MDFLNKIAIILASLDNNIEREMYISKIAQEYKISKGVLLSEVEKKRQVTNNESIYSAVDISQLQNKKEKATNTRRRQEMYILTIMFSKDRKLLNQIKEEFKEKDFINEDLKKLFLNLIEIDKEHDICKINILSKIKEEENIKLITEIMYIDIKSFDKKMLLKDLIKSFAKLRYINRRDEIDKKLNSKDTEPDEKEMLETELSQIIIKMAKI